MNVARVRASDWVSVCVPVPVRVLRVPVRGNSKVSIACAHTHTAQTISLELRFRHSPVFCPDKQTRHKLRHAQIHAQIA